MFETVGGVERSSAVSSPLEALDELTRSDDLDDGVRRPGRGRPAREGGCIRHERDDRCEVSHEPAGVLEREEPPEPVAPENGSNLGQHDRARDGRVSAAVLDASIFVALEQARMLDRLLPDRVSVSVVTLAELELGVLVARRRARRLRVRALGGR